MRSTFTCLTTIAILLGACGGDDGGTSVGGTDPGTETDPATTDPATTDPATTDPATTDPATTDATTDPATTDPSSGTDPATTDPATTDPTESSGPDPDTGTGTGGGEVCAPEGDDTPCQACIKTDCCDELEACQDADANCACVLDCLGAMKNPGVPEAMQCGTDCNADFAAIVGPLLAVQACRDMNCADERGCPPPA